MGTVMANLDRRIIVTELLDVLPVDDPRAIASRRDLVWINALMFQDRIMASLLRKHVSRPPRRILEIGCGDGSFMLSVARRMGRTWSGVELTMVDQADLLTDSCRSSFESLGWTVTFVRADIFDWLQGAERDRYDVVCANLFLHHFSDDMLAKLFAAIQGLTHVFMATEPRRSVLAMTGCALLRGIGVNDVTRHDAAASVRAGFTGADLGRLWPGQQAARLVERAIGPFTHAFVVETAP